MLLFSSKALHVQSSQDHVNICLCWHPSWSRLPHCLLALPLWWWLTSTTASCCLDRIPKCQIQIHRYPSENWGEGGQDVTCLVTPILSSHVFPRLSCLALQPTKLTPVSATSGSQTKCLNVILLFTEFVGGWQQKLPNTPNTPALPREMYLIFSCIHDPWR